MCHLYNKEYGAKIKHKYYNSYETYMDLNKGLAAVFYYFGILLIQIYSLFQHPF